MASTAVLLLQLLLFSLASASHHFGGTVTFSYKGRNPDGSFKVDVRNRATFDGCQYSHSWNCYAGNCGYDVKSQRGTLDRSTNAPRSNRQWCETETVLTKRVPTDKPFQMRAASCCWIPTRNSVIQWRLLTSVDLGTRSDTREPNRSPDIAILPFLRVPQNCPRTYKLMSFDPDGDKVRCRYGNIIGTECSTCSQPSGFHLDQGSCTLHYYRANADPRVYGFELVVEDFPRRPITLAYTDGSLSPRAPLSERRKRQATYPWTTTSPSPTPPNWWWWGGAVNTTIAATTTHPHIPTTPWWGLQTPTPPASTASWWWWRKSTTTAAPYWWWWSQSTTTAAPTTTPPPTPPPTSPWWWWQSPTPPTTQSVPTAPWWWWQTTTTAAPTTTTTPPPTPPPTSPWWWSQSTTTAEPQTGGPTVPWWWWRTSTTTAAPSTTAPWWWWGTTTTTAAPSTTAPWWWWGTTTTTAAPSTTAPWWWWGTTTTRSPTTTTTTTARPYITTTGQPYATTPPLSKLPLQFSLLVDPAAPSCQEGEYLPRFVSPTPQNGERIHAEVDKEVEIRVKAQARYSTIHDIIISGPLNISKTRTTRDEFVIRWTPIQDDLGDHYPICFAVESFTGSAATAAQSTDHQHFHPTPSSQSGIYQSEMRCVLVDVKKAQVKTNVICTETTMTVEVEKSSFSGLHEDHLQLNDPSNNLCNLWRYSNSTHVVAVIPLNACGTQLEEDEDNLIFKNQITTVDDHRDLITRKHLLEVDFYCQYPKRGNVTFGFSAHRNNVTVWEKGLGTFTYQFEFYETNRFQTMMDPNSYPLEYDVGSRVYMKIEATSSVNNTELFVESCRASPYDTPNYWPTYSIIENGCPVDETVKIHSSDHKNEFRFCMEAFKFIGLHDQVYVSCSVLMCEAGNPNTRCSKGCVNSTLPGGHHGHHRRRRDAVIQSASHFVSQGPLRLKRSAEITANTVTNLNLNLNLVFIAGCLLAAVGMISAVIMYKAKVSKVKYQPLPTFER